MPRSMLIYGSLPDKAGLDDLNGPSFISEPTTAASSWSSIEERDVEDNTV